MTVFYFLIAWGINLVIAMAAQSFDSLSIPQEYKPLISTLRDIMTPDEQGHPRHTFHEVKAIMDPLKPLYDELTTIPKLYELVKNYEEKIKDYEKNIKEIKRNEYSTMGIILRQASLGLDFILMFYDDYHHKSRLKLSSFLTCTSHLAVILNYPQEIINRHIPHDLQKIFFPFYMISVLKAVFMICDLIIDPNKEGFFYKDDYEKEMPISDLTDQLDQPFLTVFDYALQNNQINFALYLRGCSRQRLTLCLFDMLDNHVRFIKPE